MPSDFPYMNSLKRALNHNFRSPYEGETEESYREDLADFAEAHEIRSSIGWNKWSVEQQRSLLTQSLQRK